MAKKIRIIPWLDESQLNKQLDDIGKRKHEIEVNIDINNSNEINNTTQNINKLSRAVKDTNSVFGKLKSAINETFSSGKLAMTSYLLVLNEINKGAKKADVAIKDMDKSVTDLAGAMGQGRSAAYDYLTSLNKQAQALGAVTKETAEAADSWIRQGKTVAETEKLIHDSMVLSKLGKIESADASRYLTAALNGYKMSAEQAIDVVDKLTAVDMESASDAGGLAEALSRTASAADMAGISFDKLVGMIAATKEVSQASDETIGNMFKSTFARMNQIRAGKFIDEENGEALNDVEAVLNKAGIAMRDTNKEFISTEKVLDQIGEKWGSFNKKTKDAIATVVGGTYQYDKVIALFENYENALQYTEIAAESAGSAIEKFNSSYRESLESKQNTLQASFESLVLDNNFNEVYAQIIDATTALVNFINQTNALKGVMTGLAVSGGIKAFLTLKTGINEAYISLNQFQNAINITKQTSIIPKDFDKLLLLSNNLSQSQMKLLLSSKNLTNAQREQILVNSGLSVEETKLQLQTWGLTSANNGLTVATTTVRNAVRGLWNTLLANPLVLITAAISAAVMAYSSYKQKIEETRQANKEAAQEANTLSNELGELAAKYISLAEAVKTDAGAKDELMTTQSELLKKLTQEGEGIDSLTAKYGSLTEAIKQATINELQHNQIGLISGYDVAKDELLESSKNNFWGNKNIISATGDKSVEAFRVLEKAGIVSSGSYGSGGGSLVLTGDESIEGALENYKRLEDALLALRGAFTTDELSDIPLWNAINNRYKEMNDSVVEYQSAIDNLNTNLAQQATLVALQGRELPKTEQEYNTFKQELIDTAIASEQFIGSQEEISTAISSYLDRVPELKGVLSTPMEEEGKAVEETVSNSIIKTLDKINTQLKPAIDALSSAYQDIFTEKGFTLENVDLSMFDDIKSKMDEMAKLNLDVDYSSFDDFFRVLSDSESTADEVQQAFENLAYSIAQAGLSGTENFEAMKYALADLGVINDEIVAFNALINSTEALEKAGLDLATATDTELSAFAATYVSAGNLEQALYMLQFAKQAVSEENMDTAGEVANLLTLAQNAGYTGEVIEHLTELERIYQAVSSGTLSPELLGSKMARASELQNLIKDSASKISYKPEIDFNSKENAKKAAKSAKDAVDAYLDAFEDELKELDGLRKDGIISENEYLKRMRVLYTRYFKDKAQYIRQFKQYEQQYLQGMESLYQSVFSYASGLISKKISATQKEKDSAIKSYEAQKKAAEDARQAEMDAIDNQIDGINDVIDAKQDEIDAIKEASAQRKRDIDLQKAQYDLERMQNQNSVSQYIDGQMVFTTDTSGIRDARNKVDDAKEDIRIAAIEKEITALEKNIDVLEKQKDAIQDMIDSSNDYFDSMIESTEKYYDSLIEGMEEYKDRWDELADLQERAEMIGLLKELGYTEEDILNMSSGAFENFKTTYLGILKDMNAGNQGVLDGLQKITGIDMDKVPSYLAQTQEYIDSLANKDLLTLRDSIDEVADSFGSISDAAGTAASSISGGGGSGTSKSTSSGGASGAAGGVATASGSSGSGTSLKDSIDQLSTEGVENIDKISNAFAGDEGEDTTSVAGSVQKVIDKIGTDSGGEKKEASDDALTPTLKTHVEAALDEEKGLPAEKLAWEELNTQLEESVGFIKDFQLILKDLDGKTFEVTLNVNGGGETGGSILQNLYKGHLGNAKVEGTAHAWGTANVQGNWGATESGESLVGELGPELVVFFCHLT